MRFSPLQAGDGREEGNVVVATSGGGRRGWRGQAADELWARCRIPSSQADGGEGRDRPAMAQATGGLWLGEGREEGADRKRRWLPVSSGRARMGRRGQRGVLVVRGREEGTGGRQRHRGGCAGWRRHREWNELTGTFFLFAGARSDGVSGRPPCIIVVVISILILIYYGPVRFAEIWLALMFMLICCERKKLFLR